MGSKFSTSGTVEMASSKRSLVICIVNRHGKDYVSIKGIQDVISGRKKIATIWRPNSNPYEPRYRIQKKREG